MGGGSHAITRGGTSIGTVGDGDRGGDTATSCDWGSGEDVGRTIVIGDFGDFHHSDDGGPHCDGDGVCSRGGPHDDGDDDSDGDGDGVCSCGGCIVPFCLDINTYST